MISRVIFVFWALFLSTMVAGKSSATDSGNSCEDTRVLRNTFEDPLRVELLNSGLTRRNAEIAILNIMNALINCWIKGCKEGTSTEQSTMTVVLGGQTIVTYRSPCMDDFLAKVAQVAR